MFFSQAFIASALVSLPIASAAIIDVFVGGEGKLAFTPENVKANVGDSIRFTFGVKNHTVTQSTFDNPCQQMTDATGKPAGFFSGYMPVAAGQTTDLPQFWIPVRDTKPIWAFCQQGAHCQAGMVFAVNADDSSDKSFANYKAKATGAAAQPVATPATDAGTGAADPYGGAYGGGAGYGGGYGDGGAATPTPTATPVAATDAPASATASTDPATGSPLAGAAAGTGNVIKVTVGGSAGLVFTPNIIKANPGDVVQFEFQVKNHTVTQSTFGAPCTASPGGFDSGFQPVAAGATSFPTWSITINDTTPIWAYCKQANHCAQGMVLAINSDESSDKSFANFQAAAKGSAAGSSGSSGSGGAYGNAAVSTKSMGAGVVLVGLVSAAFGLLL